MQSFCTFKLYLLQIHVFMPVPAQRQAFNQADFMVPDEAGWQPHHEPIDSAHSVHHTLRSTLPLDELAGSDAATRAAAHMACAAQVPCGMQWVVSKCRLDLITHSCDEQGLWKSTMCT